MTLFLNLVLIAVLALSVVLNVAMRKVSADAAAAVEGRELTVTDEHVLGGHRLWANMSVGLIALVVAGLVLINI